MVNVKIPPVREEVGGLMNLLHRLNVKQQIGVLEIVEGMGMIAEKKQRIKRRSHSELHSLPYEETP